ncbi:MAG: hypothetical protein HYY78_21795 [Betaproteobacteria bacterium]|nr:hypothetical protein [Betaproteobacteria bacterium]
MISGNGAWGNHTPAAARPEAVAGKTGIPNVVITNSRFASPARLTGNATGVNDLRVVQTIPYQTSVQYVLA